MWGAEELGRPPQLAPAAFCLGPLPHFCCPDHPWPPFLSPLVPHPPLCYLTPSPPPKPPQGVRRAGGGVCFDASGQEWDLSRQAKTVWAGGQGHAGWWALWEPGLSLLVGSCCLLPSPPRRVGGQGCQGPRREGAVLGGESFTGANGSSVIMLDQEKSSLGRPLDRHRVDWPRHFQFDVPETSVPVSSLPRPSQTCFV